MTLILSAMTPNFIVLASDRRLTDGATGKLITDRENKAVLLYGQIIMGYTGLARLGRMPTDKWIVQTLTGVPPAMAVTVLAEETATIIRGMRVPEALRSHAYLLAGWLMDRATNQRVATSILISNFHNEHGKRIAPRGGFIAIRRSMGRSSVGIQSVGVPLADTQLRMVRRKAERLYRNNPNRPDGIVDLLINALSNVSGTDSSVGSEMLVTSFPKAAAMQEGVVIPLQAKMSWSANNLQAVYIGQDSQRVQYAPAQVTEQYGMWGVSMQRVDPQ
ncbi:hypothetical protein [Micromonospora humida]|uniref:hypothetical protein n=1 Tax=Micromonospora humida TaxID=2809018 RepID=UPI0033D75271